MPTKTSRELIATRADQLTDAEIHERHAKRVRPLIETHGAGSPRVAAVSARYARMLERNQAARAADPLTAVLDGLRGLS